MTKRSTIRYAAKQCYQLALTHGRYQTTVAGLACLMNHDWQSVTVCELDKDGRVVVAWNVPIAKAWSNL